MTETPEDLARKIKEAKAHHGGDPKMTNPLGSGDGGAGKTAGQALRAATDLVAAVAVGGTLGYFLDRWLGSKPWLMIVFLFLGFAAGFLNIYRAQMGQDYKIGFKDKG